ncbi:MAG: hypothetical protein PHH85_01650 [Candidatus Methanoperedens sp.]|nr:hypothetical protein [Candidatus Methanoperedens sp.]
MSVDIGVAQILPAALSSNNPTLEGPVNAGSGIVGSRDDHVHPLLLPIGVYVGADGYPQLETTSTLCFIWIPSGHFLEWDSTQQLFLYG